MKGGTFAETLKSGGGGHVPPVPPGSYVYASKSTPQPFSCHGTLVELAKFSGTPQQKGVTTGARNAKTM